MSKYNFFKKLIVCIVILSLLITNGIGFLLPKKAQAVGAGFQVLGTGGEIDFGDIDWGQEAINILKAAIITCFSNRVFGTIEQNYLIFDLGEYVKELKEMKIDEFNDALSLAIAQDYSEDPVEQEAISEYIKDEILNPIKDFVIHGKTLIIKSDGSIETPKVLEGIENLMYPFGRDRYDASYLLTAPDAFSVYLALSDKMEEEGEKAEEEARMEYVEGAGHKPGREKDPSKCYDVKIGNKTVCIPKFVITIPAGQVKETLETMTKDWLKAENTGSIVYGAVAMLIEWAENIPIIGSIIAYLPNMLKDAVDALACGIAGIVISPLVEVYESALGIADSIDNACKYAKGFGSQVGKLKIAMGPSCTEELSELCGTDMSPQVSEHEYTGPALGEGDVTCNIGVEPSSGDSPLEVTFTPRATYQGEATIHGLVECNWDFGDGAKQTVGGVVTNSVYDLPEVTHTYNSDGTYTAKLSFPYPAAIWPPRIEYAECSVGIAVGGGETHKECVGNSCVDVSGAGTDLCTKHQDCGGGGETHKECVGNSCVDVSGAGTDQCTRDEDCEEPTHKECSGGYCVDVSGVGSDQCIGHEDCAVVILNERSGKSCDQICSEQDGKRCLSIGIDNDGTNGIFQANILWWCDQADGSCAKVMKKAVEENKRCNGHLTNWTYCRCSY